MENFGLLNLLKTLESLSATPKSGENAQKSDAQPTAEKENAQPPSKPAAENRAYVSHPNVMEDMLKRHEQISNRIKSKRV